MRKMNKKGFTIVELVIVIAVIAILAAVLIPTYSSLVKKANQSADIQAVRQMNTILATYSDGSIKNVEDAVEVLDKEDIDLENYKPMQKDHYFYFYMEGNTPKIVYMDKNNKVVFPTDAKTDGVQLMSLSGAAPTDGNYSITDNAVTIDSGAKLAHLIEAKKNTSDDLTITLSGNVDLKGAAANFDKPTGNITIKGTGTDTVLSGLRASQNSVSPTGGEFEGDEYGFGLFGDVQSGTAITIKDLTISGLSVGNAVPTHEDGANTVGLIAGYIQSGAKVVLENVTFKDCTVTGYQKVGGLVGQLYGELELKNVKFENTTVRGCIEVAKIAGVIFPSEVTEETTDENGSTIKIRKYNTDAGAKLTVDQNCNFDGITVCYNNDPSAIAIAQSNLTQLKGDNSNTYVTWKGYTTIWGSTTNDWAWYAITDDEQEKNLVLSEKNKWYFYQTKVTIDGTEYALCDYTYSASSNFDKSLPTN